MSSTKSPDSNSQTTPNKELNGNEGRERKRQSGNDYGTRKPEGHRARDVNLDDIAKIIGGEKPEEHNRQDRREGGSRTTGSDDDERAGREADLPPRKRPALEIDDDDDEDAPKRKRKDVLTLEEFAEQNELDAKAIEKLGFALGDDEEPLTVSEIREKLKEHRDFQERVDEFEDSSSTAWNEVFTARQQIDGMLQRITKILTPEEVAATFQDVMVQQADQARNARKQLLEFFPEWRDDTVQNSAREELTEVLGTYGFSAQEVGRVLDARLIKFAMDAIRQSKRIKRLKEKFTVEHKPTKEPVSSKKVTLNRNQQARKIADDGDKVGAIAKLIG